MQHDGSGWHWDVESGGEGIQHLALKTDEQRRSLREELRRSNGDPTLEIVDSTQPGFATRASEIFHRDGFVAVAPSMMPAQLTALRTKALAVAADIVALDRHGGQKGVGRFMFGGPCSFSGSQMHEPEFAMMADLPVVDEVLTEIWGGNPQFYCTGSGGDIAMPGSEYQPLHSDSSTAPHKPVHDEAGRVVDFVLEDPQHEWSDRDRPCASVVVDFASVDLTWKNGPIRFVKGTQNSHETIPSLADEPASWKTATICPAPAGTAVFRNPHTWHGGTPNVSDSPRPIPGIGVAGPGYSGAPKRTMPREIYDGLSTRGKEICAKLVATDGGEEMARWEKEWAAPRVGLVTNHETGRVHLLSPTQLQEMRTRVGGSQTGYWPVASELLRQNDRAKM